MDAPLAVFGIGNVLLHDDAFGPQVISEIRSRWIVPEGVVVEDIGTPGLELSTFLAGHARIILVDAIAGDGPPGTIQSFDRDAIVRHPTGIRLGPHDPSLGETLLTMQLMEDGPSEVTLLGAVPSSTEPGIGLCDEVRTAASRVAEIIVEQLRAEGVAIEPRQTPMPRLARLETSHEFAAFRAGGNGGPESGASTGGVGAERRSGATRAPCRPERSEGPLRLLPLGPWTLVSWRDDRSLRGPSLRFAPFRTTICTDCAHAKPGANQSRIEGPRSTSAGWRTPTRSASTATAAAEIPLPILR